MSKSLDLLLKEYSKSDNYPFHMPGHKRRADFVGAEIDITEIEGFDNLANPKEVLLDLEESLCKKYGAKKTFCLVGGSTVGILSAIYSVKDRGKNIIIARNCHKSVYNAARVAGFDMHYIYPQMDESAICKAIGTDAVKGMVDSIEGPIAAVVITSPTYEGIVSDVAAIRSFLSKKEIPLIVDAAHGAYLPFFENNVKQGLGDITIMSLHKTMPALNPAALCHINGDLVDDRGFRKNINIFQTSSPSYPVLASIAWCHRFLEGDGKEAFVRYEERLSKFYDDLKHLKALSLLDQPDKDRGKIIIQVSKQGFDGYDLERVLREEYGIVLEMASRFYVIAMTSVMDTDEGFDRLAWALMKIDREIENLEDTERKPLKMPRADLSDKSKGVKNDIYAYPPGAPIVAESELITEEAKAFLWDICGIKV